MNTTLATQGLPEFSLSGLATTDRIGGAGAVVTAACTNLEEYSANMKQFIQELEEQKKMILYDWEGDAADTLQRDFPGVIEAFDAVPKCIKAISDWATTTMDTYQKIDQRTAEQIRNVMGGR